MLRPFLDHLLARKRTPKERRAILKVLSAPRLFNKFKDSLIKDHPETKTLGDGQLLAWLLDHSDEIIALIMKIIALFGV